MEKTKKKLSKKAVIIGSVVLAVVMKKTPERSKGISRK